MCLLSILIATVPTRTETFLPRILAELNRQCHGKDVEVLYLGDFFNMTVGKKRNHLLSISSGLYTTFVDDDDMISENYVDRILTEVNKKYTKIRSASEENY